MRSRLLKSAFPESMPQPVRHLVLALAVLSDEDGNGTASLTEIAAQMGTDRKCVSRWLPALAPAFLFSRDADGWRLIATASHQVRGGGDGTHSPTNPGLTVPPPRDSQ